MAKTSPSPTSKETSQTPTVCPVFSRISSLVMPLFSIFNTLWGMPSKYLYQMLYLNFNRQNILPPDQFSGKPYCELPPVDPVDNKWPEKQC